MKKYLTRIANHPLSPFLFLFALITIAYGPSLSYTVFLSDSVWIAENLPTATWSFFFPTDNVIHLQSLVYYLLSKLFGIHVWLFRLANILFHVGNTFLLYIIVTKITKKRIALVAASLFAIHPILTESVTWVAGGIYAMYSFWFLLSFFLYIKGSQNDIQSSKATIVSRSSSYYFLFSFLAYCLALFFNEKAVTLFLLFPIYEWCFGNLKKRWIFGIPFMLVSIFLTVYYTFFMASYLIGVTGAVSTDILQYSRPVTATLVGLTRYWELYLWPQVLTFYHVDYYVPMRSFVIRMVILGIVVLSGIYTAWKRRNLFFWIAWFFVSLALTLTPVNMGWITAERYIYLPSVGVFTLIAIGFSNLIVSKKRKWILLILWIAILTALTIRTIVRNRDWKDYYSFSLSQVITAPNCPYSWNNMGDHYTQIGQYATASTTFRKAIEVAPWFWPARINLAGSLINEGKDYEALEAYRGALVYSPHDFETHMNIADILINQGKDDEARVHVLEALKIQPKNESAQGFLNILDGKVLICE